MFRWGYSLPYCCRPRSHLDTQEGLARELEGSRTLKPLYYEVKYPLVPHLTGGIMSTVLLIGDQLHFIESFAHLARRC
ncbi:uncharacterized protein SCHCODRAFT_02625510 [Schizophyllum commune H4-8]|uniref:uncharacterized protein n=1 Tax=Schizophyllum commune (strain H4-8 / FGSC 9210) TaxID=578458 RepID=UPI0021604DCD|nr:uncharacterized protein SCHCODRAFT_02625510 [Schizophyllum commune H4-8]KAI5892175.1 hypothetical protein SCHCODRAFT_02625510 [Schizophyllum commune H4-8]